MIDKGQAMVDALRSHYDTAFNALVNSQVELAIARARVLELEDRVLELEARVRALEEEKADGQS